jgi:hypothetical protein
VCRLAERGERGGGQELHRSPAVAARGRRRSAVTGGSAIVGLGLPPAAMSGIAPNRESGRKGGGEKTRRSVSCSSPVTGGEYSGADLLSRHERERQTRERAEEKAARVSTRAARLVILINPIWSDVRPIGIQRPRRCGAGTSRPRAALGLGRKRSGR